MFATFYFFFTICVKTILTNLQQKETPWEGAVRSAGVIWSSLLLNRERTSNQLFHISDWLPTFGTFLQ